MSITIVKLTFYAAGIATCLSLGVMLAGGEWGPCGPATLPGMLAVLVFPIGAPVTVLSGLAFVNKSISQKRSGRFWSIPSSDLGAIESSLKQLEQKRLPPECRSLTIDIPRLEESARHCLASIAQQRFLTSDDLSKLELAARNLRVAASSTDGGDVSYLTELALLVNRVLKLAARRGKRLNPL